MNMEQSKMASSNSQRQAEKNIIEIDNKVTVVIEKVEDFDSAEIIELVAEKAG